MNMFTPERRVEKEPPPLVRGLRHLEFDEQRAGRIVADLHTSLGSAGVYLVRALLWSRERCERVLEGSLTHRRRLWVGDEVAALTLRVVAVDTGIVAAVDDDDELVRWFTEQEATAEEAARAHTVSGPADVEGSDDDVMLTLSGSTLTRSWRGGGTMRQR